MEREVFEIDSDERMVLRVQVQPGAGRSEVVGRHGDALKVRVAAAPESGRANQACQRLLAELFDLGASAVTLVSGATSRSKRFALDGVDPDEIAGQLDRLLSIERQASADHRPARPTTGR